MKCPKCGTDLPDSSQLCTKCGSEVSQNFNYSNMENELLNTVLEEEAINGMSDGVYLRGDGLVHIHAVAGDRKSVV